MSFLADVLAGLLTGVLSAWGIGGGTLLIVYMTGPAGIAQSVAQGINLLYFLPVSAGGLASHFKNRLIDKKTALCAAAAGLLSSGAAAFAASTVDTSFMKPLFGIFLISVGLRDVFGKIKK